MAGPWGWREAGRLWPPPPCRCERCATAATHPPLAAGDPTLWTQLGVGSTYAKAQYRRYTDSSFQVRGWSCWVALLGVVGGRRGAHARARAPHAFRRGGRDRSHRAVV